MPAKVFGSSLCAVIALSLSSSPTQASSFPSIENCYSLTCIEFGPVPLSGGVVPVMIWGTGKRGFFDNSISIQRTLAGSDAWSQWGGVTHHFDPAVSSVIGPDVLFVPTPQMERNRAQVSYATVGPLDQSYRYRVSWYPGKGARKNKAPWRFVSGGGPTFRADDVFDIPPPTGTLREWIRRLGCNGCDLQRWDGNAWTPTKRTDLVKGDLFGFQRADGRWVRAMVPGG
jgi:hypothetical protein